MALLRKCGPQLWDTLAKGPSKTTGIETLHSFHKEWKMNAEKISLLYIHVHFARDCTTPWTKSCYRGQLQSIISNGKGKLKPRVNVRPQQLACMPTNNVYMIGTTKSTKNCTLKCLNTLFFNNSPTH
jgi:hypothetical protein